VFKDHNIRRERSNRLSRERKTENTVHGVLVSIERKYGRRGG
jgi:hypothetical protein